MSLVPYLPALVIATVCLVAGVLVDRFYLRSIRQDQRAAVTNELAVIRANLEGVINGSVMSVRGVAAAIEADPAIDQERFARLAHPLFGSGGRLRNIAAAPDMVITCMYPLAGNEAAVGLDYRTSADQRVAAELARDTGRMILAGPVRLVQGGDGFIGRIPIWIEGRHEDAWGGRRFWGLVSATLDAEQLYRSSGCDDPGMQITCAIRGRDGSGPDGEPFHGDPSIFGQDPVLMPVTLPYGSWQLAAIPKPGWAAGSGWMPNHRLAIILIGLALIIPMVVVGWLLERRREALIRHNSELKLATDRANRMALQAEQASIAKSRFLSTMSHEIRTPLNGVIGMSDMLDHSGLSPDQHEMVKVIQESGRGLLAVIGDVLDIAKIESGNLALVSGPCEIRPLMSEIEGMFAAAVLAKGLRYTTTVDPAVPRCLRGDSVRLRQVLINLVANAVKFTEQGDVSATVAFVEDGGPRIVWTVADTGPGIPDDYLPHLFEPFTQANASTARRYGGTGLGLAIARQLALLMKGSLEVESLAGRGCRFRLSLPCEACAEDAAPGAPQPDPSRATAVVWAHPPMVLVAEDDPINQVTIGAMLSALGCRWTLATDGRQAIDRACAERFDLVLMDCQMPGCDGYAATQAIRQRLGAGERPQPPIIALSANVFTQDRERCRQAGMDDFVSKPCTLATLKECLSRWLGRENQRTGGPRAG